MGQKENAVQAEVMTALKFCGVFCWRNNNQGRWMASKQIWIKSAAFPGIPDIIGVSKDGKLVAVECKSATGTATAEQLAFISEVSRRGGIAFVAKCSKDVFDAFKSRLRAK